MAINCLENTNNTVAPELTWRVLSRADQTKLQPFRLVLADSTEHVNCDEVVRIIPGKRLAAFGTWNGKKVVAKLFYQRGKAKRHLMRDVLGIEALVQASIPAPQLLYKGSTSDKRIQILLFERLEQAKNLADIWVKQNYSNDMALMQQVVIELATQHVLGIVQRDLHLKNFLVTENRIYTLDGGSIKKFPEILGKKQSMDNLGLFFAQLGAGTGDMQQTLYKVYAKSRGWQIKQEDIAVLEKIVKHKNKARWRRYKMKMMRTCSAFVKAAKWNQVSVYDRDYASPELLDFIADPEKVFSQPGIEFLKKGHSATVAKIKFAQRYLVVKRYNIKNHWHWLRRCLRPTRAATSWRLAQHLQLFGVATAKPVAYVEKRFLGLRKQSYFLMEYITGQDIGVFFSTPKLSEAYAATVASKIVKLLHMLGDLKMTHGDLKLSNILLANDNPVLIDLDGMHAYLFKFQFKQAVKSEVARFMKNWDNNPPVFALFSTLLSSRMIPARRL